MQLHGIDQPIVDALLDDINAAPVSVKMKPIFAFAKKLTLTPSALTHADADAIYEAGWSEEALHTVIAVVCRFNFMNRLVMAHGLTPPDAKEAMAGAKQRLEFGYAALRVGFESHEARAMRRTRSMTEAA